MGIKDTQGNVPLKQIPFVKIIQSASSLTAQCSENYLSQGREPTFRVSDGATKSFVYPRHLQRESAGILVPVVAGAFILPAGTAGSIPAPCVRQLPRRGRACMACGAAEGISVLQSTRTGKIKLYFKTLLLQKPREPEGQRERAGSPPAQELL